MRGRKFQLSAQRQRPNRLSKLALHLDAGRNLSIHADAPRTWRGARAPGADASDRRVLHTLSYSNSAIRATNSRVRSLDSLSHSTLIFRQIASGSPSRSCYIVRPRPVRRGSVGCVVDRGGGQHDQPALQGPSVPSEDACARPNSSASLGANFRVESQ
jgi:hypothetical protein